MLITRQDDFYSSGAHEREVETASFARYSIVDKKKGGEADVNQPPRLSFVRRL